MMQKSNSYLIYLIPIISIIISIVFFNSVWALAPEIYSITPNMGSNETSTHVTVSGVNFHPAATVALYGGGPYISGSCDTPASAYCVYVAGSYAYVADRHSGLQVIDITDPTNPALVGSCDTLSDALGVHVAGSYAYVADAGSGLQVIDITDSANPALVGSCDTPGDALGVHVAGSYAYVADRDSGLQVIDISDPANPAIVSSCDTSDRARAVHVAGSYAYVADGYSGLQVIDITDPSKPALVGPCNTPGSFFGVHVAGSYAYLADYSSGLYVIDITNPTNPALVGSCNTPGDARAVHIAGSYAYVADGYTGLQVIDITDPSKPALVGSCGTPSSVNDVHVTGSYAYVALDHPPADKSGLLVIDISDPANPAIVDVDPGYIIILSFDANGVHVAGSYAYVTHDDIGLNDQGLFVIDITNPSNPFIVGSCSMLGYPRGVHVTGSYAYVAAGGPGLQVIDITDPFKPTIVGSCDTPGWAEDIHVAGSYAYVADGGSGLQVIDITDPSNPFMVGTCDTPTSAEGVHVAGSYVYVADNLSGLQIIDISDPANPAIMDSYDTPNSAVAVHVAGSYAYVADSYPALHHSGLQVIEKFSPLTDIVYVDSGTLTATIPTGYRPGTYNLHVINPDGGHAILRNAFTVYAIEPVPLIKVDGQKQINILPGTPAIVSLGLDPGSFETEPADYFVWIEIPSGGIYYLNSSMSFVGAGSLSEILPVSQMDVITIPEYDFMTWNYPIIGTTTFHFAVDLNQNGQLDPVYYEDNAQIVALPLVDIKINGQDNLTTIIGDSLSVTINLDPGTANNQVDLFIWIKTPVGILNLTTTGWVFKFELSQISPAYQGALGKIQDLAIISSKTYSSGECSFHFAIDFIANGVLDTNRYEDIAGLMVE